MVRCICGKETNFKRCCGALLSGKRAARDPEELVRARYTAFVKGDMDFLLRSHHSRTACRFDVEENRGWAESNNWQGFEIVGTELDGSGDRARVEFIAEYEVHGLARRHHEISDLRREDGVWCFYDGEPGGDSLV